MITAILIIASVNLLYTLFIHAYSKTIIDGIKAVLKK